MRQLELIVGEPAVPRRPARVPEALRVRQCHLARSGAHPRRADAARTSPTWSRAWVEDRGRPEFTTGVRLNADGPPRSRSRVTQRDPHEARSGLAAAAARRARATTARVKELPVDVTGADDDRQGRRGAASAAIRAAERWRAGLRSVRPRRGRAATTCSQHIEDVPDALTRGSAWVTLWDNLLDVARRPRRRCSTRRSARCRAKTTSRMRSASCRMSRACSGDSCPRRASGRRAPALEAALRAGLARGRTQSQKAAWFNAYRDVVLSPRRRRLARRACGGASEPVPGLTLAEPDEIAMALELAVREVPGWDEILRAQHRAHAESRSQGAARVRDAGAVGRSRRARARRSRASGSSRTVAASRGCSSRCSI